MPRSCHPFLLRVAAILALALATAAPALAWPDPGPGAVTGQRDATTGAGTVGAALQSQMSGFVARTGVTFDIPANGNPGFAAGWGDLDRARRSAGGKAEASVSFLNLPWFVPFWRSVRFEASFDPQAAAGAGQVGAVFSRSWSLVGLTASSEDRYMLIRDGMLGAQAPVTRWEVGRNTRLELPWHSTALLFGGQVSSDDRLPVGTIGAEQTLFGPLKINASLIDLGREQVGGKITAGFTLSW
jgi:hypothetical protein